eukprot:gnl/TRDRNA2_/TRDRNA2_139915_c2_seq1.p3 gnl/TRDRNA2_/TRDRNA2_139915_c2~~gnl/TRDRNA2_/TRDRNA2_139915_c2_seq1.p3  ORF type:complete len:103 (-),score=24.08 gnl/TRDRNA2_/TRDRNA2_139915_c2_seq1:185-493(-)
MDQMKAIAYSINMVGPAISAFDGLKDYLATIRDLCDELQEHLIELSAKTSKEIIAKTNNALDAAMRTSLLLAPDATAPATGASRGLALSLAGVIATSAALMF